MNQVLTDCLAFVRDAEENESSDRSKALQALRFENGDQWPQEIQLARELENRPCLTVNKTRAMVRQVLNGMRQQRPRMIVHPVGNGADEDKAEVIQGLLRHIEVNSGAEVAYDTAAKYQVIAGKGYWRVTHRYISEDSFDQELYIDPIDDPFTVYFDPSSVLPDGSDAETVVVSTMMPRDEFKRRWPGKDLVSFDKVQAGSVPVGWSTEKEIRVGEYWRVEKVKDTLVRYSNGWTGFQSKLPKSIAEAIGLTVVEERPSYRRKVMLYMCSAVEILESHEWAGKFIPIVPVYGNRVNINGDVSYSGMVEDLMDPARMYNFWRTSEAEVVALAPKAPWVMAEGQDDGHEAEWDQANTKSYSRLIYKPVLGPDGQPVPPPTRLPTQEIPQANVNAAIGAGEDMKSVAGIYDASLGNREQDPSGIALGRHQQQSELSNFHFYDNQCVSLRHTGVICLDLIPSIYDTERVLRIIGEDGEASSVTVNQKRMSEMGAVDSVLNDMTVGRYDIVMDTGPGYNTKRIESAENMLALLQTPLGEKIATVADDIVVRHFDWSGARDLADRLAAANPIAQSEALPDLPEQAQAMVKQLQGQVQQLQQALQGAEMEKKYRLDAIQLKEDAQNKRTHFEQQQENQRHVQTLAVKTHDVAMRDATKRHDAEFRASTQLTIAEINAMAQLMGKHIDTKNLMAEIEAEDRRTAEMAQQQEPIES